VIFVIFVIFVNFVVSGVASRFAVPAASRGCESQNG